MKGADGELRPSSGGVQVDSAVAQARVERRRQEWIPEPIAGRDKVASGRCDSGKAGR